MSPGWSALVEGPGRGMREGGGRNTPLRAIFFNLVERNVLRLVLKPQLDV